MTKQNLTSDQVEVLDAQAEELFEGRINNEAEEEMMMAMYETSALQPKDL